MVLTVNIIESANGIVRLKLISVIHSSFFPLSPAPEIMSRQPLLPRTTLTHLRRSFQPLFLVSTFKRQPLLSRTTLTQLSSSGPASITHLGDSKLARDIAFLGLLLLISAILSWLATLLFWACFNYDPRSSFLYPPC